MPTATRRSSWEAGWPPSGRVGSLLGIDIQYHAQLQFGSFIRMVDAVGGVDVDVVQGFGPDRDGYGLEDAAGRSRPVAITWMGATPSRSPGRARRPARATSRGHYASSRSSWRCGMP